VRAGQDLRVGGGRGGSDTPSGSVTDKDGGCSGETHGEQQEPTSLGGAKRRKRKEEDEERSPAHLHPRFPDSQVQVQVLRAPILDDDGSDDEYGDTQQVVIEHAIPILEPGDLDPLPHAQDVSGGEDTVHGHP
jgi:hypothetical protein